MLYNLLYLELVRYMFLIGSFIPAWVFVVMLGQVFACRGVIALSNEDRLIEFVWTFIPTVLTAVLCYLNLQYLTYESVLPDSKVVKIVGRQWYWTYELPMEGECYDSCMSDFVYGVDKPLRLTVNTPYRLLVTSADVIHCFSVPECGIKIDGIPGRINQVYFCPERLGVFVGYCSELCGAGHAYMPIVIEVVGC
uniref:cytochrome-c oxidase n=1 Tax=Fischoederius elongatus TaxID=691745 RepID=A0A0M3LS60_FISEL|nr:cytochrome c oxidase subunit II [Fischoederius elongatus]AJF22823.1 cytochrome c oxidase subunit II [Fischoederius elongatus]QIJ60110.1 cytochrome c oxidase subunit II [Fischoederius elongatus]